MATFSPGNEPEEVKKYLDAFLSELDQVYPEGIVVMDLWNHERWDKMAGWLVSKLGYENGTEFLEAYHYVVFKENSEAQGRQGAKQVEEPPVNPTADRKPAPKGPTKFCVSCGAQIPKSASVCPECGEPQGKTKFCKHCGARIDADCVVCPKCGKQVEELKSETPASAPAAQQPIIINNTNTNTNVNKNNVYAGYGRPLNNGNPVSVYLWFMRCRLACGYDCPSVQAQSLLCQVEQQSGRIMKYCKNCGSSMDEQANFCEHCGQRADVPAPWESSSMTVRRTDETLKTVIKVFMILGCIGLGWLLVPLAWCIPLTVHVFHRLDADEPIDTGVKICSLLFVNLIAGICMLCMNDS